jgi:hypothetical protein
MCLTAGSRTLWAVQFPLGAFGKASKRITVSFNRLKGNLQIGG